jgi:hypothetical protein
MEKAMANIPQKCPSCSAPLVVTQLTCSVCGTGVVGHFELSPFFVLQPELAVSGSYIRNRGNVKEMEQTGECISYPTPPDEVIAEMAFTPSQKPAWVRQEIRASEPREITAQEAASLLTQLGQPPTFT